MNRSEPIYSGIFYHVYNRGNDRGMLFRDKADYLSFIDKALDLAENYSVELSVYTIMPNHCHFIVNQHPEGSLSKMMGALATSTARRHNLKYGRIGHLFQGPYKYRHISEDSLWRVAAYVHLNPVRARFVEGPEDWPYSNYMDLIRGTKQWENYSSYVTSVLQASL